MTDGAILLGWPAKPLWPNHRSRVHWPRTAALKSARVEAFYATRAAKVSVAAGDVPIRVLVEMRPPDRRVRDYDNCEAALKPIYDGIADALGVNDSAFRPVVSIGEPVKGGAVVVRLA